jgi:small subunit ribosomal protein S11
MIVRRSPLRVVRSIRAHLGERKFSAFLSPCNDNQTPSQSPRPASPSVRSGLLPSLTKANSDTILTFVSEAFEPPKHKKGGTNQTNSDVFQPASMSNMPLPTPGSSTAQSIPLPLHPINRRRPGYLHIHAVSVTKNIHITITDHNHNTLIAMSAGRLGLKHSKRQTREAAHDTAVAAFEKLASTNYNIQQVELILKGFGKGRQGFLSAISGQHGEFLKDKVVRITDATPLRIGGTRLPNKRRR